MNATELNRNFLFYLYILFNILLTFYFIFTGFLGGDFEGFGVRTNNELIIFSLVIVILSFILLLKIIFPIFERIKTPLITTIDNRFFHMLFLVIAIFYVLCSLLGVSNTRLEHTESGTSAIVFHLYSLLSPQNTLLIYSFYAFGTKNKIYWLCLILLVIGYYLSGTTFVLLYLLPIFIFYSASKNKKLTFCRLSFFSIVFLLCYPILRVLKYGINTIFSIYGRLDETEISTFLLTRFYANNNGFFENYFEFLSISFARFQHVSNIQYLFENSYDIKNLAAHFHISNIDFFLFRFIHDVFFTKTIDSSTIQNVLAYHISGIDVWASHIGFIGYGIIYKMESIFIYLFILSMLFLSVFISKMLGKKVIELVWLNCLIMIVHGWFSPYVYFCYGLMVFMFIIVFINFFRKRSY